ncbi:hypothetical protein JT358_11525 [Micrococcales bacterium 31B]|nr:hypothetical protein [Micrococcales bacterium 31B]
MALYANGQAPAGLLMTLPDTPQFNDGRTAMALAGPCIDLYLMRHDCERETGHRMRINDLYRDLDAQSAMLARYGYPRAARVGTSNHGNPDKQASDIDIKTYTEPIFVWIDRNGMRYGYKTRTVKGEPWHIEHQGQRAYQSWNRYLAVLLGATTVKVWQRAAGTPVDGIISAPASTLIRRSQEYSNRTYGMRLVVDGIAGPATIRGIQTDIKAKAQPNLVVDGLPGAGTRAGIRRLLGIA